MMPYDSSPFSSRLHSPLPEDGAHWYSMQLLWDEHILMQRAKPWTACCACLPLYHGTTTHSSYAYQCRRRACMQPYSPWHTRCRSFLDHQARLSILQATAERVFVKIGAGVLITGCQRGTQGSCQPHIPLDGNRSLTSRWIRSLSNQCRALALRTLSPHRSAH